MSQIHYNTKFVKTLEVLMNNSPKRPLILTMWFLSAFFYGYEYFLQVSPSVMTHSLMQSFHVSATTLGYLAASYFFTYTIMQFMVGVFLDYLGARRLLTLAALLCGIGSILFCVTTLFPVAMTGRLLIGIGASFAAIGNMYIAGTWFPSKHFALLTGFLVTIGMLGAACGQAPMALLVNYIGWRGAMMILGAVGLLLSLLMWVFVRDKVVIAAKKQTFGDVMVGLRHVVKNKQIWLLSSYGVLIFMSTSVIGSLWGTPFLMQKYGITNTTAGMVVMVLFFGWAAGTPFWGWLSNRINRRKSIMITANVGALCSMLGVIYLPATFGLGIITVLFFTFGLFSGGFIVAFAAVKENDTTKSLSTAVGFMNAINMLGGATLQPLVGWFLDLQWTGKMSHGVRAYSTIAYHKAFFVLVLGMILASVVLCFIRETYCTEINARS